jgi:hypothetical protein
LAVRATVPILINRVSYPAPTISSTLTVNPSPLAIAATMPALGGTMVLPAQTPLVISVTETEPFVAPAMVAHTVAATLNTSLIGGEYLAQIMAQLSTLVGYWRLNESSGLVAIDTKNGNNGTYTGGATLAQTGPFVLSDSLAARLVSNSYVTIPDSAALDVGDVFTLECIVKRTSTGVTQVMLSKQASSYVLYFQADNTVALGIPFVGNVFVTTNTFTDTTAYHHIACTKNGSTVHIYVDGVDEALTGSNQTMANNSDALLIGLDVIAGSAHATNNYMAEVAIYNTALSGATILNHYNAAVADGM